MRHRGRTLGLHPDRQLQRSQAAFVALWPEQVLIREQEIQQLPSVEWRGRRLRTIRCAGDYGKGPHDVHVPESLLWSLIHVGQFRCPYHR